ncbi:hypothetical protein BGY98DRAFT_369930 [Russula aff. rugulosa BPL654]|nr:hypothetical protein BGY98DRAFT_369930 [Russula aff. rugulosa BPL654]
MRLAEERGLGVDHMEDIILVTGRHLARSWVRAVFSESRGAEVSFVAQTSEDSVVHFEDRNASGAQLDFCPNDENLPENQRIFVRGYHVVRKLKIWPRIRGLAGPAPDLPEPEPDMDLQLTGIPADTDDPLYTLLEYIAEQNPSCDMVLVLDDDLKCIENAILPLETLQPDTLMECLRDFAPKTGQFQCESFFGNENESEAEVAIATVATLFESLNVFGRAARRGYHLFFILDTQDDLE